MTKYVLAGGYPEKAKDGGHSLCQVAASDYGNDINIVICLFARPKHLWESLSEESKKFFRKNLDDRKCNFLVADSSFIDQIKESNILYISGGDYKLLIKKLNKFENWYKNLNSKTIIGSSASTDLLSTYNYDLEYFKCSDGLGLVPVKTFVHFKSPNYRPPEGWSLAYENLLNYKDNLPIWKLREGEFKVYKKLSL
jgi:hypothetical protein